MTESEFIFSIARKNKLTPSYSEMVYGARSKTSWLGYMPIEQE
jgi:hypothetical protein